jgi:hypothetical protein
MNLNSDFSTRAVVHAAQRDGTPSPIPGVYRRMLDCIGDEVARDLWQFDPEDRTPVRIDTSGLSFAPPPGLPGVEFAPLHESAWEVVLLERWAPGIDIALPLPDGIELLVLDGSFIEGGEEFTRLS